MRLRLAWEEHTYTKVLWLFVLPAEMPGWQLASCTNAILFLVFYYVSDRWYQKLSQMELQRQEKIAKSVVAVGVFRGLLSSYIILCNTMLLYNNRHAIHLPDIGPILP